MSKTCLSVADIPITPPVTKRDRTTWETPPELYERLAHVFRFDLDPCATPATAKCARYFVPGSACTDCGGTGLREDLWPCGRCDGLRQPWANPDGSACVVWLNPPYGRELSAWLAKANDEARRGATVVALLPGDTSTRWWHEHVEGRADVWRLEGRVRFVGASGSPNFASVIAVYWPAGFWRGTRSEQNEPIASRPAPLPADQC